MPVLTNPAIVPYVHWLNRNRKKIVEKSKSENAVQSKKV